MESKSILKRKFRIQRQVNCDPAALHALSEEQLDYLFCNFYASSFLHACPGSGKTEVIGWKTAFEFSKWNKPYSGIAVISFTNSATNELFRRIRKYGGDNCILYPHFVGTFDSWIHNFIMQPYAADVVGYNGDNGDRSFRIVDSDSEAAFLHAFTHIVTHNGKPLPIKAVQFHYDVDGNIQSTEEKTSGLLKKLPDEDLKALKKVKIDFFKHGFCTYADAEMLAGLVLKKRPAILQLLAKRFPVIMVDECQDLADSQIQILERLREAGSVIHLIGDLDQSIYSFRKVDPNNTKTYIQKKGCKVYKLTNNYRSCQAIVGITQAIMGREGGIKGMQEQRCQQPCILLPYDDENFEQLPNMYRKIIERHQLNPEKCAILARGIATLRQLRTAKELYSLKSAELIANALHHWFGKNRSASDITEALTFLGRAFSLLAYEGKTSSRNFYCPQKVDPIEWRICLSSFIEELAALYPFLDGDHAAIWTKWVLKLKGRLACCWSMLPETTSTWDVAKNKLRAPQGMKDEAVEPLTANQKNKQSIRTTTIHSVKGETMEAILFVSHWDKSSKGGHFSHWIKGPAADEEHLRFAYVACSRPKHLLVVAIKPTSEKDVQLFTDMGFSLYQ
jgi:DNA helicase-2/ATP-dependent DNA helicase PcrA